MPARVAIFGDFDATMHTHAPLLRELQPAAAEWVSTRESWPEAVDGVLLAPGSPYADFGNVLAVIRRARETGVPLLGICGGFQHVLIEFARNVLGWAEADSAEHGCSSDAVIVPMACRLDGRYAVRVLPDTYLASLYGGPGVREETYFCGYQADASREGAFVSAGLTMNARAEDGAPRGCELAAHPFFVATAFQPQMTPGHPVLRAFVAAAAQRALQRAWESMDAADYAAHMSNTGQAAANARLSAELLAGFDGGELLVAGAGPGQMLEQGLSLERFQTTFTDVNPAFLREVQRRAPQADVAQDDLTNTTIARTFSVALVVLVLEHVDWRRALVSLARLADHWLIIIQRNPPGMISAVTPGAKPPGAMRVFADDLRPHLIDEAELTAAARERGFRLEGRREASVADGKTMVGLHFRRGV